MARRASRKAAAPGGGGPFSLAARLDAWARVFVQRSDVVVDEHVRGKPWRSAPGSIYLPGEVEQFYTESNGYSLHWTLKDGPPELKRTAVLHLLAYKGSEVIFKDFHPLGRFTFKCFDAMRLDAVPSKNQTWGARATGGAKAKVTILSGFSGRQFASFDAYLAEGARSAFNLGWQFGPSSGKTSLPWCPSEDPWVLNQPVLDALKARSLPAGTEPARLRDLLAAKGLSSEEAQALWDWVGPEVRLLLEAR